MFRSKPSIDAYILFLSSAFLLVVTLTTIALINTYSSNALGIVLGAMVITGGAILWIYHDEKNVTPKMDRNNVWVEGQNSSERIIDTLATAARDGWKHYDTVVFDADTTVLMFERPCVTV